MCFFRVDCGSRRVAILDRRTSFLQSDKFPPDIVKSLLMFNPIAMEWELFRHGQSGPLYGENSAPRRWEDTYSPYLESEGFRCGFNDRSIFYNPERDVVNLTYSEQALFRTDPIRSAPHIILFWGRGGVPIILFRLFFFFFYGPGGVCTCHRPMHLASFATYK